MDTISAEAYRDDAISQALPLGVTEVTRLYSRKKEKAINISVDSLYLCRQRPTLPHTFACSTIGPAGLNFRVRDGNGWNPRGMITDKLRRLAGVNESRLAGTNRSLLPKS